MQTVIDLVQRNGVKPVQVLPQIQSRVETVTPQMAKKWLEEKAPNRIVSPRDFRVLGYAKEMKAGKWRLGDPLMFDVEGRLIDGQHRLAALIIADLPIQFVILSGYPSESMIVLDTGKARTVHQSLTIAGIACTKQHIAILNAMFQNPGGGERRACPDRQLLADLFQKHSEAVSFACRTYSSSKLACKHASIRGAIARAYYHIDHETLVRFLWILDGRATEEKRDRLPFLLRNQHLMHRNSRRSGPMLYGKALYAIRAFADHKTVELLREAKTQPFPVPDFD